MDNSIGDYRQFYLNSKSRLSGTEGNFFITLPNFIVSQNVTYTHCMLMAISIPKSMWSISTGQNTFTLIEGSSSATIIMPLGTYNRLNFMYALQTQLNTSSPSSWTYSITIPNSSQAPDTGFYTYTASGGDFTFVFPPNTLNPCKSCGFDIGSTNTSTSKTLVSTELCDLSVPNVIYVRTNIVGGMAGDWILDSVDSTSTEQFGVIVKQNDSLITAKQIAQTELTSNIWITLTTEYDNTQITNTVLDLNGLDLVLSIMIFNYRKNPVVKAINDLQAMLEYIFTEPPDDTDNTDDNRVNASAFSRGRTYPYLPLK